MLSNESDTRDLLFSNPTNVFLDISNKTKYESGISSSFSGYNQTGTSADFRYQSSQDLFSQKYEKTDSQYEATNSGYQKYVAENLLLGRGPSPKVYSSYDTKKTSPSKDIKQLLTSLKGDVDKLNLEIGLHNDKVNILHEDVLKLKEFIGKEVQSTDENCKALTKLIKKDVLDRISEVNHNVIKIGKKVDEQREEILKDTTKNIFKSHEMSNKHLLQSIQTLLSKTDNKIEKMLSTSIEDIKKSLMQNVNNYRTVGSPVQERTKFTQSIVRNNIYAANNKRSEELNTQRNSVKMPKNHTPLAYYMDSHNSRSNSPAQTPGFRLPNMPIRRKVATPLAKLVSPFQGKERPQAQIVIKRRNNNFFHIAKYGTNTGSSTPAFSVAQVQKNIYSRF